MKQVNEIMEKNIILIEKPDISIQSLLTALKLDEDDEYIEEIENLLRKAIEIAKPVALYSIIKPEFNKEVIKLNEIEIAEPFVFKMLSGCDFVIPYIASCGPEINEWSKKFTDFFDQFVADTLKILCLMCARDALTEEVKTKYFPDEDKHISTLNPGSLEEWPLTGQISLFDIFENVDKDIGVILTDSLLMTPTKSVSGIMFQTEEEYHNCQLCQKENCPGRRAEYIGD